MKKILLILVMGFCINVKAKNWEVSVDTGIGIDAEFQLDPYYSAADLIFSLGNEGIKKKKLNSELDMYGLLIKNFYKFKFALTEVSLNPLPLVGVAVKSNARGFYNDTEISENLNLVRSITSGFPEPGALSFFMGNVMDFTSSDGGEVTGRGYSGALLSLGSQHIVNNELIDTWWYEIELKVKGADITPKRTVSWSFSLGYKGHEHPEIVDLWRFSIKRDRSDPGYNGWSIYENARLEWKIDFHKSRLANFWEYWDEAGIRYTLIYGKKYSLSKNYLLILNMGVVREMVQGYVGSLAGVQPEQWTWVIQPNVEF
jgi:hypothetical protein